MKAKLNNELVQFMFLANLSEDGILGRKFGGMFHSVSSDERFRFNFETECSIGICYKLSISDHWVSENQSDLVLGAQLDECDL